MNTEEYPYCEVIATEDDVKIFPLDNRPAPYEEVLVIAKKVFGDHNKATLWLHERQFTLDGKFPIHIMRTQEGVKQIITF